MARVHDELTVAVRLLLPEAEAEAVEGSLGPGGEVVVPSEGSKAARAG